MSRWEKNVRRVEPYVPGEQPREADVIKLNTNENPYPPSAKVLEALKRISPDGLRRYPAPDARTLVRSIADFYGRKPEEIFVGVGSDDVLAMSFLTFFNSDQPVLFPDITYSFYDVWCELFRIPYRRCPLDENFHIVPEDYYACNGGIVLANPNAPTGEKVSLDIVEEIIARNPDTVVIVDEAYIDFGGESALPLIDRYENLLIVQTCSKSRSLAGMRIGYAFGNEKLIRYLNDVKYSFNSYTMNEAALVLGTAAFQDRDYLEETVGKIIRTRESVKESLRSLGFQTGDSCTNFLFVTHPELDARELFEALKREKIYVRYWNKPRIDRYLRITVGTEEEMNTLLDFIRSYIPGHRKGA